MCVRPPLRVAVKVMMVCIVGSLGFRISGQWDTDNMPHESMALDTSYIRTKPLDEKYYLGECWHSGNAVKPAG